MYSKEQIFAISNSDKYKSYPLQFLRTSKLSNDLQYVFQKKLKLVDKIEDNVWLIYVFAK